MSTWIHEKMKVASDESYRDPTNLQTKLQKHQAFDAELSANKGSVDAVCKVHYIRTCIDRIRVQYKNVASMY